jgi:hypothetical protein
MPLQDELLSQARMLASLDGASRPISVPLQANLRRAVSSAYYAVFHLFISESVGLLLREGPPNLAARVSRSFSHSEMSKVCGWFAKQQPTDQLRNLVPGAISAQLQSVATIFVQLQEARHRADYDIQFSLDRQIALAWVEQAEKLLLTWNSVRGAADSRVFLAALAFGSRWSR